MANLDKIGLMGDFWIRPAKAWNHGKFIGGADTEAVSRMMKVHILEQNAYLNLLLGNNIPTGSKIIWNERRMGPKLRSHSLSMADRNPISSQ